MAIAPRARRRAPRTNATADRAVELTPEQEAAVAAVREGGSHLLHGVTGSGKTEVYLRACADALARGRGVIVLVPEIALTPQTVSRFQARFGDTVALLHSALGEGERYDEWRRLRTGEARIAVGPRSAVFAPVADLGLVVSTRSTTAPTSTRATRATTPGSSRPSAPAGPAPRCSRARRRRGRRPGGRWITSSSRAASTPARSRR